MIKPLNNRVLVKRSEKDNTTATGIIIPGTSKDLPSRGIVIGNSVDGVVIDEGSEVIFGKYAGVTVEDGAEEYVMIDKVDILGIIVK